jgi:hypothetical protein
VLAKDLWKPWNEIIAVPTIEDVIENLVEAYDPIAVDYALAETVYEEYIPEKARGTSINIRRDNLKLLAAELGISGTDFPPPAVTSPAMKPKANTPIVDVELSSVEEPALDLGENKTTVHPENKQAYENAVAAMSRAAKKS